MAVSDIINEALLPLTGEEREDLRFTVKFNCDIDPSGTPSIRSNYWEASHDLRIVVNGTTVYEQTGSGKYWDAGSGSGTVAKMTQTDEPVTAQSSYPIWYTLSAADVSASGIQFDVSFDVIADAKHYTDSVWTEVIRNTITLTETEDPTPQPPAKPTNPTPAHTETSVSLGLSILTWEAGV
jgi:hypothetical protein